MLRIVLNCTYGCARQEKQARDHAPEREDLQRQPEDADEGEDLGRGRCPVVVSSKSLCYLVFHSP